MEPRIDTSLRLPALDGFELAATLYEPDDPSRDSGDVVLINSATAVRRGYYDAYARYLAGEGSRSREMGYTGVPVLARP